MKSYTCRKCGYSGIRPDVRKHIREEHRIKGKTKVGKAMAAIKGHKEISAITSNTICFDIN